MKRKCKGLENLIFLSCRPHEAASELLAVADINLIAQIRNSPKVNSHLVGKRDMKWNSGLRRMRALLFSVLMGRVLQKNTGWVNKMLQPPQHFIQVEDE